MKTIVLLLLVALASAEMETKFREWMTKNNKVYASDEEFAYRLNVWTSNYENVQAFNAEEHSWKKGINKFSDLTKEEFAQKYLMTPRAGVTASGSDITEDVDWVSAGAVTSVKNQKECGSCWAFGTVGGIEGCYQLAGYTLTDLSEQQLVDCVSGIKYNCDGCSGGLESGAMDWMIDNDVGLETYDEYPYTSLVKAGTCSEDSSEYLVYITSYKSYSKEADLQDAALLAPVTVGINAEELSSYDSGIYCPSVCSALLIDHSVLVVGMSSSENAYTIKNSWGADWGESGYFRLCGGNDECGVGSEAVRPTGCSS